MPNDRLPPPLTRVYGPRPVSAALLAVHGRQQASLHSLAEHCDVPKIFVAFDLRYCCNSVPEARAGAARIVRTPNATQSLLTPTRHMQGLSLGCAGLHEQCVLFTLCCPRTGQGTALAASNPFPAYRHYCWSITWRHVCATIAGSTGECSCAGLLHVHVMLVC